MPDENLESCPFCGGIAEVLNAHGDDGIYFVECCECDSHGPGTTSNKTAVILWNMAKR